MLRSFAVAIFAATVALLRPSPALADDASRSYAERARVVVHDDVVRLYGLPTKDTEGNLRYFDAVITIKIGAAGKPKRADVSAVPSPPIDATSFVPGPYAGAGVTCTLGATQESGQPRLDLTCTDDDQPQLTPDLTWYAGDFAANPFLPTLQGNGIDDLPGHEGRAWGLIGDDAGNSAFTDCLVQTGNVFAAAQVGPNLVLTYYGSDDEATCSVALLQVEP